MEGIGGGLTFSDFESSSAEAPRGEFPDSDTIPYRNHEYTEEELLLYQNGTFWLNDTYYNDTLFYNGTFYDPMTYTLGFKIAIAVLYNSVFITALLGNALVCYVVFSSPRMRTVTNYLIANLAAGDLLMVILCVPFSYIPVLLQYWPFGKFLCYLLCPAQAVSVLVSSYTLIALAADRYMAILYPLRPRFRRSQACWVIAVVWLVALITATPIAIFTEYYQDEATGNFLCEETGWRTMNVEEFKLPYGLTLMILQYFFPLVVLIFTYSRIAMAVWGKKSLGEAEDSRDQRLAKTKRKTLTMSMAVVAGYTLAWLPFNLMVLIGFDAIDFYPHYIFFACHSLAMMIKMMLIVVIVYTVSWLPLNLFLIIGDIWPDELFVNHSHIAAYAYPFIHFLAMAHTIWNAIIYSVMNRKFRDGFRAAVSKVPCCWKIFQFCRINTGHRRNILDERKRSYFSNTRLTRTNTTCTTYTFGSGSLHNLHNTTPSHYNNVALQQNGNPSLRKHSCLIATNGRNRASNASSISVSLCPTKGRPSPRASTGSIYEKEKMLEIKASNTMNSIGPSPTTPVSNSSPSSGETGSIVNFPMTSLSATNGEINGHSHKANGQGNGAMCNGSSYVSISQNKNGKPFVTTSVTVAAAPNESGNLLSRKRSSSSGVSESFM